MENKRKELYMRTLIDRLILLICVVGIMCLKDLSIKGLVVILLIISLAGFMYYINERKYGALVESFIGAVYSTIVLIYPMAVLGAPIIIYEYIYTRTINKKLLYMCELLRIYSIFMLLYAFKDSDRYDIFIIVIMMVVAIWMAIQTKNVTRLEEKLVHTIDTDAEYQLELKKSNRMLLEKQDNEVYMATLKERNRIAREIHDNVGHMLVRSIMQCGAIITINKDETLDEHLKALKETLDNSMTSIRSSVHDLHDDAIDLKNALEDAILELKDYKVSFEYDIESAIERNVKCTIIAIVKEAITNIVKHSNAKNVQIIVREHPAFIQIIVNDDGTNIKLNDKGIGLSNIRDRAEMLSGTVVINTDAGFKIFVNIPRR
ncbi:MAG: hypothetical protein E7252_05065 [Lachnospira sp.]|nr:hypothetical protein [Lachnospira sp.]